MAPPRRKSAWLLAVALLAAAPARAEPADGGASMTSTAACVGCHRDEAGHLAGSRHGLASSPGLWGQLPTTGPHVGTSLSCLVCHAPASDQQRWLSRATPRGPGPGETATEARVSALAGGDVAPNPGFDPHAEALGVSCTGCHLEGGHLVGTRADPRAPHEVLPRPGLAEDAALCARCHQFGPASAVNGKPLEDTVAEWQAGPWGQAGASCQGCHLPEGRHQFPGIHTPWLVKNGVEVAWTVTGPGAGALSLTNSAVGHAFPTYVTPRVTLRVQAGDAQGRPLGAPAERVIGRDVEFVDGHWVEHFDTRVLPRATATLAYQLPELPGAAQLHATVRVEPDAAYVRIYRALLAGPSLPAPRRRALEQALRQAEGSGFDLWDEVRPWAPTRGSAATVAAPR